MPFITIAIIFANIVAYLLRVPCETYGLVPAQFSRSGELGPILSGMFLHANIAHIVGNMVFLAVFGAIVETSLGHLSFLGLYLAAGIVGGLMHVLVNPAATDPLVGASGAIFGVIAVAAALRPRLLGFVVAFGAVSIWQAFTGADGSVSFGCHIGGLFMGALTVMLLKVTGSDVMENA
jgi:membrane associated rhomboid family serine protease